MHSNFPKSTPSAYPYPSIKQLVLSIHLHEWILAAVLAAALGAGFILWSYLYEITKPILKPLGLKYLTSGFWLLPPLLSAFIIRKPIIPTFSMVVAAAVESTASVWGIEGFYYALLQGLGVELILLMFLYRNFSFWVMAAAASLAAVFSFGFDYYQSYTELKPIFNLIQLSGFIVSAIFFSYFSILLCRKLLKTGLLDQYLISRQI